MGAAPLYFGNNDACIFIKPYLEKFKIYCLVFNDQKPQAQLLLDLLREQKQSDKFFDDKINYLLGISEKTSNKINQKNNRA